MEGLVGPPGLPSASRPQLGWPGLPSQYMGDLKVPRGTQRRPQGSGRVWGKPLEEQLRVLGLFNLKETEGRHHRGLGFLRRSISHLHCLVTGHKGMGENGSGKFRLLQRGSSPRGCLGSEQAVQGMVMASRPPELRELLDNALKDARSEILVFSVQGNPKKSELDVILMCLFQLRILSPDILPNVRVDHMGRTPRVAVWFSEAQASTFMLSLTSF